MNTDIGNDKELATFITAMRGELHRYCARLTGSVFDGEDLVQEAIMRVLQAEPRPKLAVQLRAYIFRTAHNAAIDMMRSKKRRGKTESVEGVELEDDALTPFEQLAHRQAVALAIGQFLQLPQPQRSIVILKDVLGEKTADIGSALGLSMQSVKAHLHRGRLRLGALNSSEVVEPHAASPHPQTRRYVEYFNTGNWDGLRAMLAEDVVLRQTAVAIVHGRTEVAQSFFSRYIEASDWKMSVASVEGREVVWVADISSTRPEDYFMVLAWREDKLISITDFRHARYVAHDIISQASGVNVGNARLVN